jgi:hypothetical protein
VVASIGTLMKLLLRRNPFIGKSWWSSPCAAGSTKAVVKQILAAPKASCSCCKTSKQTKPGLFALGSHKKPQN